MTSCIPPWTIDRILKLFALVGLVATCGIANCWPHETLDTLQSWIRPWVAGAFADTSPIRAASDPTRQPWSLTGRFHQPLAIPLDLPSLGPIAVPAPSSIGKVGRVVAPHDLVVGLVREGRAVAVPLAALAGPSTHIAILAFPQSQVAITHCDLSGCTRVLTGPPPVSAIDEAVGSDSSPPPESRPLTDLHVGGLDRDGGMVLLFGDTRYAHTSPDLPLVDQEFRIMELGQWQATHPETVILDPRDP